MNKRISLRLSLLAISMVVFIYVIFFSAAARKSFKNAENIHKVKVGMTLREALEIMGEADDMRPHFHDKSVEIYYYTPPFGA